MFFDDFRFSSIFFPLHCMCASLILVHFESALSFFVPKWQKKTKQRKNIMKKEKTGLENLENSICLFVCLSTNTFYWLYTSHTHRDNTTTIFSYFVYTTGLSSSFFFETVDDHFVFTLFTKKIDDFGVNFGDFFLAENICFVLFFHFPFHFSS